MCALRQYAAHSMRSVVASCADVSVGQTVYFVNNISFDVSPAGTELYDA